MSAENPKKTARKPGAWTGVRKHLEAWDKPALLGLLKDLFEATAESRDFMLARCQAEDVGSSALEKYRARIVEQFYPKRGEGKLQLGECRKAIKECVAQGAIRWRPRSAIRMAAGAAIQEGHGKC